MAKTPRHRTQVMMDEDLYYALKKLPREVSISDIINLLFKLSLEELKAGREMTQEEFNIWIRKDPQRVKVRMYLQEKLGPYIDVIDGVMARFKGKKGKK